VAGWSGSVVLTRPPGMQVQEVKFVHNDPRKIPVRGLSSAVKPRRDATNGRRTVRFAGRVA
jgi:hypothetical protein